MHYNLRKDDIIVMLKARIMILSGMSENEDDLNSSKVEDDEEESSALLGLCIVCQAPLKI